MSCKLCDKYRKKYPLNAMGFHQISSHETSAPIQCHFDGNDNWACRTLLRLRDLAEKHGYHCQNNDTSIWVIMIPEDYTNISHQHGYIIMTAHKHRGRTNNIMVVGDTHNYELQEKTAEWVIDYYRRMK